MSNGNTSDVTQLLGEIEAGASDALDRVYPIVYDELRRLAQNAFRDERPDHTLQTTALVNEAYLRLVSSPSLSWQNRRHFFGIAAQAMRQILVEHARRRGAQKRGSGKVLTLDEDMPVVAGNDADVLGVNDALDKLNAIAPRAARVVELRYFAGLSIDETAAALEISTATVKRDWLTARAWLVRELS